VTGAFLHPFARPARERFITLVRGEGALVYDADGTEYVDGMASLWYCAIGHGRTEMADAIAAQAATLAAYSCFDPFTNGPADELAEKLVGLTPMPGARVFFCQSGSEAVDTAMKLARLTHVLAGQPERTLIISRMRGYHGTNYGGTTAQGLPPNKEGWGPLVPDVEQVASDDIEALATLMSERGNQVAAVIAEPVQGAGGVWPPPEGYLHALRRLCDQHGALLIFDEVITGFGRLGRWFAADHYGVTPDLTTFAKAITSGYQPLGGVLVGRRAVEVLESDASYVLKTGYTYSGHATACAAGIANLAIMEREGLLDAARHVGQRLGAGLQSIADDGLVDHVRGEVAVWAIGMGEGQDAVKVRDRMLELGVITRAIGDHSCTFCPPLVISDEQIDRIIDTVAAAVGEH
jgi:adenosylmethionine-8-amino-7-oxononanoate aminotransferase